MNLIHLGHSELKNRQLPTRHLFSITDEMNLDTIGELAGQPYSATIFNISAKLRTLSANANQRFGNNVPKKKLSTINTARRISFIQSQGVI